MHSECQADCAWYQYYTKLKGAWSISSSFRLVFCKRMLHTWHFDLELQLPLSSWCLTDTSGVGTLQNNRTFHSLTMQDAWLHLAPTWHLALGTYAAPAARSWKSSQLVSAKPGLGVSVHWFTLAHFGRCTWPELPAAAGSGSPSQLALVAEQQQPAGPSGLQSAAPVVSCWFPSAPCLLRLYAPPPSSETKYSTSLHVIHCKCPSLVSPGVLTLTGDNFSPGNSFPNHAFRRILSGGPRPSFEKPANFFSNHRVFQNI